MSRATYPLKLPRSIKEAATRLAREDGVSLNQWIAAAVAEKVGATETASHFLARRSQGRSASDLETILTKVPDCAPVADDEMPDS